MGSAVTSRSVVDLTGRPGGEPASPLPARWGGQEPAAALFQRQLEAIDAWNASRRTRASPIATTPRSRDVRAYWAWDLKVLTRTHQALLDRTADQLARDLAPLTTTPTAVIAHRHGFYAHRLRACLEALGVRVLHCSENAPDALAAVIAEQPSGLFVTDQLVMMTGRDLLRQTVEFSPRTVLAAQGSTGQERAWLAAGARATFTWAQPPGSLAEWLCRILGDPAAPQPPPPNRERVAAA